MTAFGGDAPMRRDTPFRIASMTKPVLAAAAMMLAEDDRLDLEEPIVKLLPELASTADDYLAFARLLLNRGVHGGTRLLTEQSVAAMTTNHLTPEQIESGGMLLDGSGWGYGMGVTVAADEVSGPGRYGWSGGYGTSWFNDPAQELTVIVLGQVSDLLWSGALTEFGRLASVR